MLVLTRRSLLALVVALALAAAPAQAQTTLRYKFKEGQQTNWTVNHKMSITMEVGGQEIVVKMSQLMDLEEKIASVDKDGAAKASQRIGRWRMEMETPMGKVEVDSKGDQEVPDDLIAKALDSLLKGVVGTDFEMTLSPLGEVGNVKVPAKFLEAIKNSPLPGFDDLLSEESLKQLMTQGALILPKEAVSKGKSWKSTATAENAVVKTETITTSTYEGTTTQNGKKLEKIGLAIDIKMAPKEGIPAQIKVMPEKSQGTALFDNAAGRVVETQLTQILRLQIEVDGQTVNQRIESTATLKLRP